MAASAEQKTRHKSMAHRQTAISRSDSDKAALERIRRKLVRLMLVSLTVTFITLAAVIAAIIYKTAHTRNINTSDTAPDAFSPQQEQQTALPAESAAAKTAETNANLQEKTQTEARQAEYSGLTHNLQISAEEQLESASLSGNLVLLRLKNSGKDAKASELIIYDFANRAVLARIRLTHAKAQ